MSSPRDAIDARVVVPNSAWQQAAGRKETAVRMDLLPAGLAFDAINEPIWYDSGRKLLLYRGFLCNASYVRLLRLSKHPDYIAALDQLYQASTMDEQRSGAPLWRWVAVALTVALAAAGLWLWRR